MNNFVRTKGLENQTLENCRQQSKKNDDDEGGYKPSNETLLTQRRNDSNFYGILHQNSYSDDAKAMDTLTKLCMFHRKESIEINC